MSQTNIIKQSVLIVFFTFPLIIYIAIGYLKNQIFESYLLPYVLLFILISSLTFLKSSFIRIFLVVLWLILLIQPIYLFYSSNFLLKRAPSNFVATATINNVYGMDKNVSVTYDAFGWRSTGHKVRNLTTSATKQFFIFHGASAFEQNFIDDKKTTTSLLQSYFANSENNINILNVGGSGKRAFHTLNNMKRLNKLIPSDTKIIYFNVLGGTDWNWATKALLANSNRKSNPLINGNPLKISGFFNPQSFILTDLMRALKNYFNDTLSMETSLDFEEQHKNVFKTYQLREKYILEESQLIIMEEWYEEAILKLVIECNNAKNTSCVFIDQPTSWTRGDFESENFLSTLWFTPSYTHQSLDPNSLIRLSSRFNMKLEEIILSNNCSKCFFIKASNLLDNPDYFYDDVHFNNYGAENFFDIIKNYILSNNLI